MIYSNSNLTAELEARATELQKLINELQARVTGAPEGKLKIATKGDRIEYYHRENEVNKPWKYISQSNNQLAKMLAQKDYDFKLLKAANNELKAIQQLIRANTQKNAEQKLHAMSPARQKLITSIDNQCLEFIEKWSVVDYEHGTFKDSDPEYYASDGTRVRSKSESIIMDTYLRHNIPCHYEKPLVIGNSIFRPDFYLLNTRTMKSFYHEHLGMMDNPGYANSAVRKLKYFEKNGIIPGKNLIITMEVNGIPINYKDVENIIREYLQ